MKRLVILLLLVTGTVHADPVVGESVIFRYDSTHIYPAVITRVLHDNVVNLVALTAMYSVWYSGGYDGSLVPAMAFGSVDMAANTDYRWIVNPDVPVEGPVGATGATGTAGPGSNISGLSTPTLALNGSSVQFDSTHDTIYTAVVEVSGTISLAGGFDGLVSLLCDANSTPTTFMAGAGAVASGTVVVGLSLVSGGYYTVGPTRVKAADRCRLTTTNAVGTPSYSIITQKLQTLAP